MWLLEKLKYTCNSSIVFNKQVKRPGWWDNDHKLYQSTHSKGFEILP
jgi:transposase